MTELVLFPLPKICSKCRQAFPATNEYFPKKLKKYADLTSWCKRCPRAYDRENTTRNRIRKKAYYLENSEHIRAKSAARYATKKTQILVQMQDYRSRNKEKISARDKAYRNADPQRTRRRKQADYLTNRETYRSHNRKRRARQANAPRNDLTPKQWKEIQLAYKHRCVYCGKRAKGKLTQDHIQPLIKGGSHTASNIVPACRSCNCRKHDGPPLVPVQPLLLTIAK